MLLFLSESVVESVPRGVPLSTVSRAGDVDLGLSEQGVLAMELVWRTIPFVAADQAIRPGWCWGTVV